MYNQCLTCGSTYGLESTVIIDGCYECGGKRFSYTANPLPKMELQELRRESNNDLGLLMEKMYLRKASIKKVSEKDQKKMGLRDKDKWFKIEILPEKEENTPLKDQKSETMPDSKKTTISGSKRSYPRDGTMESIRETSEGVYEIDLELMLKTVQSNLPIVLMEKGVYLINFKDVKE